MANNIYTKKGKRFTQAEQKMIEDIEAELIKNPDKKFLPANNFEQLTRLHTNITADEAEGVEEIPDTSPKKEDVIGTYSDQTADITDPHNESAPNIREYVKADMFQRDGEATDTKTQNNFDEPTNWDEAFDLPDDSDIKDEKSDKGKDNSSEKKSEKKENKRDPINPDFDDMSTAQKNKETKEFAETIVEGGCTIIEMGVIWYATKDFTDPKLIEMEMAGEIDLDIMLNLGNNQMATVRDFFNQMEVNVKEGAKFDPDYKKSLARSLYKVMLEKGIAPTPMQSLMGNVAKGLAKQAGLILVTKIQANSVLDQLREMKRNTEDYNPTRASDTNEQPLDSEGVANLFKDKEPEATTGPTIDEGPE